MKHRSEEACKDVEARFTEGYQALGESLARAREDLF